MFGSQGPLPERKTVNSHYLWKYVVIVVLLLAIVLGLVVFLRPQPQVVTAAKDDQRSPIETSALQPENGAEATRVTDTERNHEDPSSKQLLRIQVCSSTTRMPVVGARVLLATSASQSYRSVTDEHGEATYAGSNAIGANLSVEAVGFELYRKTCTRGDGIEVVQLDPLCAIVGELDCARGFFYYGGAWTLLMRIDESPSTCFPSRESVREIEQYKTQFDSFDAPEGAVQPISEKNVFYVPINMRSFRVSNLKRGSLCTFFLSIFGSDPYVFMARADTVEAAAGVVPVPGYAEIRLEAVDKSGQPFTGEALQVWCMNRRMAQGDARLRMVKRTLQQGKCSFYGWWGQSYCVGVTGGLAQGAQVVTVNAGEQLVRTSIIIGDRTDRENRSVEVSDAAGNRLSGGSAVFTNNSGEVVDVAECDTNGVLLCPSSRESERCKASIVCVGFEPLVFSTTKDVPSKVVLRVEDAVKLTVYGENGDAFNGVGYVLEVQSDVDATSLEGSGTFAIIGGTCAVPSRVMKAKRAYLIIDGIRPVRIYSTEFGWMKEPIRLKSAPTAVLEFNGCRAGWLGQLGEQGLRPIVLVTVEIEGEQCLVSYEVPVHEKTTALRFAFSSRARVRDVRWLRYHAKLNVDHTDVDRTRSVRQSLSGDRITVEVDCPIE